jgi:zinc transporter ZupT
MNIFTILLLLFSVIAGAIIVEIFCIKKKGENIQLLLTFSGAYLFAVCMLHLIPEIFTSTNTKNIGLFILTGFLIQIVLEHFSQGIEHGHFNKSNAIPFSVLISLCLHSLLEGVPLGGHLHNHAHNNLLTAIVLHKLPVSIVLMTLFLQSKMSKKRAYFLLFLFALMSPLGVISVSLFSAISNCQNEIMAIVVGLLLHISTTILFEVSNDHKFSIQKILTIIIGAFIVYFSL